MKVTAATQQETPINRLDTAKLIVDIREFLKKLIMVKAMFY